MGEGSEVSVLIPEKKVSDSGVRVSEDFTEERNFESDVGTRFVGDGD